jgi:hypothetical protein
MSPSAPDVLAANASRPVAPLPPAPPAPPEPPCPAGPISNPPAPPRPPAPPAPPLPAAWLAVPSTPARPAAPLPPAPPLPNRPAFPPFPPVVPASVAFAPFPPLPINSPPRPPLQAVPTQPADGLKPLPMNRPALGCAAVPLLMNIATNAVNGSVPAASESGAVLVVSSAVASRGGVDAPPPPVMTHNGSVHDGSTSGDDTFTSCTDRDALGGSIGRAATVAGASVTANQNAAPPRASPATVTERTTVILANPPTAANAGRRSICRLLR